MLLQTSEMVFLALTGLSGSISILEKEAINRRGAADALITAKMKL
jgi:hypothetical protein